MYRNAGGNKAGLRLWGSFLVSIVRTCEVLSQISLDSNPSIEEIVSLFGGMLVRRNLKNFIRVIDQLYESSPLGVGDNPSRFRASIFVSLQFGTVAPKVIYGAQGLDTAIYESVVRSQFDIEPNRSLDPISYAPMSALSFSTENSHVLNLLDLTNGRATCFGVPTDVIRSSDHKDGQYFSQFVFENMPDVDGFIYASRYTEQECVALYRSRVITRLTATDPIPLSKDIVKLAMSSKNITVE